MNKKEIRPLKANEVECKVGKITEKGCQLLLYKTARTDMDLLDETFGAENWECEYKEIKGNLFCGIRVYFGDRSIRPLAKLRKLFKVANTSDQRKT